MHPLLAARPLTPHQVLIGAFRDPAGKSLDHHPDFVVGEDVDIQAVQFLAATETAAFFRCMAPEDASQLIIHIKDGTDPDDSTAAELVAAQTVAVMHGVRAIVARDVAAARRVAVMLSQVQAAT